METKKLAWVRIYDPKNFARIVFCKVKLNFREMFLSLKNVKMNKSFFKDKVNLFKQLFLSPKSLLEQGIYSLSDLLVIIYRHVFLFSMQNVLLHCHSLLGVRTYIFFSVSWLRAS